MGMRDDMVRSILSFFASTSDWSVFYHLAGHFKNKGDYMIRLGGMLR